MILVFMVIFDMVRILAIIAALVIVYKGFFSGSGDDGGGFSNRAISEPTPVRSLPASERTQVILFTATEWCPPCRQLDRSVIASAAWREFAAQEIQFRIVDVPGDRSRLPEADRSLLSRFSVRGYPTMVILDRSGREVARRSGAGAPVENYKAWIRHHAG